MRPCPTEPVALPNFSNSDLKTLAHVGMAQQFGDAPPQTFSAAGIKAVSRCELSGWLRRRRHGQGGRGDGRFGGPALSRFAIRR